MAMITRDEKVAPGEVHDRMPGCLTPDVFVDWLDDGLHAEDLLTLLDRESLQIARDMEHYEVSQDLNSVQQNLLDLLEALP